MSTTDTSAKLPARGVYRHADLKRALDPASIAIVGISPRAGSFGERTLKNLARYDGRVHLVNAKYDRIGEQPCFPSLKALPEVPDCVIITLPREAAEDALRECAEAGVGGVILNASGYSETGKAERIAQQENLTRIARAANMRLLGPNCIGVVNYLRGAIMSFTAYPWFEVPERAARASIGLVSQSGALSQSLGQAVERGVSLTHLLTSGNSSDVDVADLVSYLADDPSCSAIACVFEGMSEPTRIMQAAEIAWAADKPLIINKLATGEQGAAAALSHTGSLAGSNAAYKAAFERTGIVMVDNFEALIEAAAFFAKAPQPKAKGVAVIATSGGASIMAADKAELYDVALPQPEPACREVLESLIPEFGSARNPCDVTAQVLSDPASLSACGNALLSDPNYGIVVVPQPFAYDVATPRIKAFNELAIQNDKMACNVWLSEWLEGPGSREGEAAPRVAMFRSMERCFAAIAAWHWRSDLRQRGPRQLKRVSPSDAAQKAARLIDASPNKTLTEREAKEVLAVYGVPVVGERLTHSADEAARAATELGYPVVMKVESPDLPHKTEAGVIRLNLKTEADVRAAYDAVMANAHKVTPPPRINGVLVQPMVPPGAEAMVGARIDPQFGPLIVAGLGGVLVELLKDTSVDLAPVTPKEARAMIDRLKGVALFTGFRGSEPVDLDKLADVITRLSEFAADQQDRIAELDVNPLICAGARIAAVDALIVKND